MGSCSSKSASYPGMVKLPKNRQVTPPYVGWYNGAPTPAGASVTGPKSANTFLAFYGFSDPIEQMKHVSQPQVGKTYNAPVFGGAGGTAPNRIDPGFDPGYWSPAVVEQFTDTFLSSLGTAGWNAICFDFELGGVGADQSKGDLTIKMLEDLFERCKGLGLVVMVTTSHTAPYGFPYGADGSTAQWTRSWLATADVFSPQMYTNGITYDPTLSYGTSLDMFKGTKADIVGSIPAPSDYSTFATQFEDAEGYFVWYNFS